MSYRDDLEALYTRATILQRELDAANDRLAAREAELAALRGESYGVERTSPGMRALRELPDIEEVFARIGHTSAERHVPDPWSEPTPLPMPDLVTLAQHPSRHEVLAKLGDLLPSLDEVALVLVGAIVEELVELGAGGDARAPLLQRLRAVVAEINEMRVARA